MISINNLSKHYGNFALNISMDIEEGTVTGLVGKNGAGKSTTIKALLGLIKPDAGEIKVFGKERSKLLSSECEEIGVALAESGFCSEYTITNIIKILKHMYSRFDEAFFRKVCTEQNLPFDKKIKEFSTGMKAKLRVLVAISHQAKLLVLDEPTAGLDVIARNEVLDMLRAYVAEDSARTIIISSHISSDLEGLCDDIYFIDNGEVLLHEDTDTILGQCGILKLSEADYAALDKQYLLSVKKESFGYTCLTNEKMYYVENNPKLVVENGNIDDMIVMMLGNKNR